ncbi:MAG: autoinducer-2 kinase [Campylobacterales bacterium]|nr:autoinducer-2 kinase [Campylobacterales bacterium]
MSIDAGTGSIRAVVFDLGGRQLGIAQQEWHHFSEPGVAHSMSFDCKANWQIALACIVHAIADARIDAKQIKAISATSMREGIVVYDREGEELFALANVDARAGAEVAWIKQEYPELERHFYERSGQTLALGALPRLLWLKRHRPKLYEKAAWVHMISDWVLYKLSGVFTSEPSNAGTSGIFSLKERRWDAAMASRLGLKDDIFPEVVESGSVIGTLRPDVADVTGLDPQTKIVAGGGDVQLGSAGLGVVRQGECAVLGGSFWQQIVNIEGATVDPTMNLRINPHVIKGLSQAEGITFFSGIVMRWFRDTFCQEERREAERLGVDVYSYLESLAAAVPVGSYGIVPIFSDTMKYGRWYHAAPSFLNLSLETTSKAAMFRALQENGAMVSMFNLEAVFALTQTQPQTITFAGGGAKGALWAQILSDVTGREVRIPRVIEATALGGAMAAAVGLGVFADLVEASQALVAWERTYSPDGQNHRLYQEVAQRWRRLYDAQLALVDQGLVDSMWRAPGV